MNQLPLPVQLRASSVFANFFRGANASAVDALLTLRTGERPVVVWLCGPGGVGKTHLLQALCAQASAAHLAAAYLPLLDATLKPDYLAGCETLSFLCLDDFDARVGDAAWERAIFRLHTEFEDSGGRLIIAAKSPPGALAIALKDLASRLAIGTLLRLQPLSDEEQVAALTLRATRLGLELPQEAAMFLLRRLPRDMTTLCNALDTLDRASLANQRRLTLPFVRGVVEGFE